jgi:hypothetical protein
MDGASAEVAATSMPTPGPGSDAPCHFTPASDTTGEECKHFCPVTVAWERWFA